jgi:hypothetical protein
MKPHAILLIVLLSMVASHARADATSAAAQLAFDKGKELMAKEHYAEACPTLARSFELEAAIGTQFMLAECYEKLGQVASAWRHYVAVADTAARVNQRDRESYARTRADEVRKRVPTVTLRVDSAALEGAELELRRNDEVLDASLLGSGIPVDPGKHRFELRSSKHETWSGEVETEADGQEHAIDVVLVALPDAGGTVDAKPPSSDPDAADEGGMGALGIAGIVVGVAGVIGMGVGIGVGVAAKSRYNAALDEFCNGLDCDADGAAEVESAQRQGNTGTIVFGVGAGLAAAGLAMVLIDVLTGGEGGGEEAALVVAPAPDGALLGLHGSF